MNNRRSVETVPCQQKQTYLAMVAISFGGQSDNWPKVDRHGRRQELYTGFYMERERLPVDAQKSSVRIPERKTEDPEAEVGGFR